MLSLQVYKLYLYKDIDLLLRVKIILYYKSDLNIVQNLFSMKKKYKI